MSNSTPAVADDSIHRAGAGFRVIVLDQSRSVEEVASHLEAFRSFFLDDDPAIESLILAVAAQDLLQGDRVIGLFLARGDGLPVDQVLQGRVRAVGRLRLGGSRVLKFAGARLRTWWT